MKQTRTEVDRYRSMDRLIPSPHNVVTIAALEVFKFDFGEATSNNVSHWHFTVLYGTWYCEPYP